MTYAKHFTVSLPPPPPPRRHPQLFTDDERARLREENPQAGFPEISKLLSLAWKECGEEKKADYVLRSKVRGAGRAWPC
jgi:hypothetical protein